MISFPSSVSIIQRQRLKSEELIDSMKAALHPNVVRELLFSKGIGENGVDKIEKFDHMHKLFFSRGLLRENM